MYDWQDLRFFLAVHREGSLSSAASALRVDPTTVGRRLSQLEHDLGQPLFLRSRAGWTLTPFGSRVLPDAERVEEAAHSLGRAPTDVVEGRVRLTTVDVLATEVVAPALPDLYDRHPGLRVDILCTPHTLDLLRGEADLALRAIRPAEEALIARRLAAATERPYAAPDLLVTHGQSPDLTVLHGLPGVVTYGDEAWVIEAGGRLAMRTSSANVLIRAARSGVGVAMLPDVIAGASSELVPLHGLGRVRERPLWLAMHRDLSRVARVRAVADFLVERFADGVPAGGAASG